MSRIMLSCAPGHPEKWNLFSLHRTVKYDKQYFYFCYTPSLVIAHERLRYNNGNIHIQHLPCWPNPMWLTAVKFLRFCQNIHYRKWRVERTISISLHRRVLRTGNNSGLQTDTRGVEHFLSLFFSSNLIHLTVVSLRYSIQLFHGYAGNSQTIVPR